MIAIDLTDRTAIVTGATRGIGRAVALCLGRAGARLTLNYHSDDDAAQSLHEELAALDVECHLFKGSVTDAAFVDGMVKSTTKRWGRLDILVNNAGVTQDTYLAMMPEASWDEVIDTNLRGVYVCTKRCIKPMIAKRRGSIVNMSSQSAVSGRAGQTNYAASKAALLGFTRSLAREVGTYNVRVNAIIAGLIDTDMTRRIPGKHLDPVLEQIPLGRVGEPAEVAHLTAFLASDLASYMTGSCVEIGGGL